MKKFTPPMPADIKPALKGQSDKFSWRLYCWMRKNCTHGQLKQIFQTSEGELIIGNVDEDGSGWIRGARLNAVLCGNGKIWAYPPGHFGKRKPKDITKKFWTEYLRIGVCSIHDHGHLWSQGKKKRTCLTCGRVQVQRVRVRRELVWVDQDATK